SPRGMDRGSEGCAIWYGPDTDPAANTLYCGTLLQTPSGTQPSLWAINTLTGALRWSYGAGSIQNRPILKRGSSGLRVYVVNHDGSIMAYSAVADPGNAFQGLPLWSTALQVPLSVQAPPFGYTDPISGRTALLLTDLGGNIRIYYDQGATGVVGPAQNPS